MGEVKIDHGGIDVLVSEQSLDGVQARSGLDQVGGEAMTQCVDSAFFDALFLAGLDHEALQRTDGHGSLVPVHAGSGFLQIIVPPATVWKNQQRVTMECPVAAQVPDHS